MKSKIFLKILANQEEVLPKQVYPIDGMTSGALVWMPHVLLIPPWKACSPLEGGGGGIVTPPPTGNGTDFDATINSPENGTWLIAGDFLRISGTIDDPDSEYDRAEFKVEIYR